MQTTTTQRTGSRRRGRTRAHDVAGRAFRDSLRRNHDLGRAIRSAVEAELMAREITYQIELAQHPRTVREEKRRSDAQRIQRQRDRRRIYHGLERLARRWRASLTIAPDSWLRAG